MGAFVQRHKKQAAPLLLALVLPCQACSFTYFDTNGDRHVIGLVDVTVHPAANQQTFAGDVVDLTSVGLTVGRNTQGGFVAVGYSREISAALRDNALVTGDLLAPAQPAPTERDHP